MLTTKQALLSLLVLGVLGMHGLVAGGCTTAAHHAWPASFDHHVSAAASGSDAMPGEHDRGHSTRVSGDSGDSEGNTRGSALVLCLALLLAFAVAVAGGRRTTWVSRAARATRRVQPPFARILPGSPPVLRFTVMRC